MPETIAPNEERKYRHRYLYSQWTLVIITLFGFGIGIFTLRRLTESNDLTRQNFQATQRPYVSLGRKDGTLAEFVEPKDKSPTEPVGIKLYFQNAGQSAALTPNVGILATTLFLTKGASPSVHPFRPQSDNFQHLFRIRTGSSVSVGTGGGGGAGSIAPQSEFIHLSPRQVSEEQLSALRAKQRLLILNGNNRILRRSWRVLLSIVLLVLPRRTFQCFL
jgi:hypothetical protein